MQHSLSVLQGADATCTCHVYIDEACCLAQTCPMLRGLAVPWNICKHAAAAEAGITAGHANCNSQQSTLINALSHLCCSEIFQLFCHDSYASVPV